MRKLFASFITILSCGAAYALPLMNPSDASLLCDGLILEGNRGDPCDVRSTCFDAFSLRVGFYGDYAFNRHMKSTTNVGQIERTRLVTNAALLVANFYDRIDIFSTLGASSLFIDTEASLFSVLLSTSRAQLEANSAFSWSVGARGTVWEVGCTSLGAEFQYFRTKPHVTRLSFLADGSAYPPRNVRAKYDEWQVGVGISHRINIFVPYIGVKWSHARVDMGRAIVLPPIINARLPNLKNTNHIGYAVGVSLIDCEKVSLTAEGRFGDERALHVNGQIRF